MIRADTVRHLREATGAGVLDAKRALEESNGDVATATDLLRKKGQKISVARAGRATREGVIETYLHPNRRIGVMVELRCESDFVARNEDFRAFAHELALQVAATNPQYLNAGQIPADVLEKEREIAREQVRGKPANVIEKIVDGKIGKFASEHCLLQQTSIRDGDQTIEMLLHALIAKIGENITIERFVRFSLDE